ncbi:MAG: alpha/beta hydrolase [Pyrinomonadaceae bacterium MAG19_C2-C3]|nr:alpha/beta hydrolase [Pyrinomonadaceae bacterium MAG19_C2-C3]
MKRTFPFLSLVLSLLLLLVCTAAVSHAQSESRFGGRAQRSGDVEGFADINGARIFYTISGRGEPLVLIHGYPLSGDLFSRQRAALSRHFQVVTLDLRGFGRSVAPNEQASIDIYANDVLALMDFLRIKRAIIGGHSMGGITTLNLYRLAPSRFDGMILIDTIAAPAPTLEQFQWRGYAQQSREMGADSLLPFLLPQFLTGETRLTRLPLTTQVASIIRQASLNGLVGGANALAERPDLRGVLPTITVPTLIIFGVEDPLTSFEVGQMLRVSIADSLLGLIPNSSHAAILERGGEANFLIRRWAAAKLNYPSGITDSELKATGIPLQ